MRFDRESYRKLYVRESAEDRMMPIFARGLRDYLLRFAAEDGTLLRKTRNAKEDLARALGVHKGETKAFGQAVDLLIEGGYLTLDGGRLWITRFEEAQEAKSKGATRTARWRANQASRETSPDESRETSPETSQKASRETSPIADETRRELADPLPPASRRDVPDLPDGPIRCPGDLWDRMPEDAIGTLETCLIPRWAQEQICKGFAARMQGKRGNERPIDAWVSTAVRVIQGDWQDTSKRPKKPVPEEPDEAPAAAPREKSYTEILREEEARAEAARQQRATP